MSQEGFQENIISLKDARGKVIKIGDSVRFSELGRKEMYKLEPNVRQISENPPDQIEKSAVSFRGKVVELRLDGSILIEPDYITENQKEKNNDFWTREVKPEYLIVE